MSKKIATNWSNIMAGKMAGTNPDSAGQCRTTISGHCAHVAGREHCREHCRTVPYHHFGTLYPYSRPGTLPDSSVPPFRDTGGGWGAILKKSFFLGKKIMMSKMVQGSFWQKIIKSKGFKARRTPRSEPGRQKQSEPSGQMSKRSYGDPFHDRPG